MNYLNTCYHMHCIDLLPHYMYLKIYFSLYNDIYNIYVIIHHCVKVSNGRRVLAWMSCLYTEEQCNGVPSFLKQTNHLLNTIKLK